MKGLILETSSPCSCAILASEGALLDSLHLGEGPDLSKNLGLRLRDFLHGSKIDFISVGIGPGSYTGIRVGAAIAQALAYGWNLPLFSFCSLLSFVPEEQISFAVVLDSGTCLKGTSLSNYSSDEDLVGYTLFSPHPEKIRKKLSLPVLQAKLNQKFLASYCCREAPLKHCSALTPLPFLYK